MREALHIRTTVQPGGKIEVASPELDAGQSVDVVALRESNVKGCSIMEILNGGPEHRLFQTAEDVRSVYGSREEAMGSLTLDHTRRAGPQASRT